MRQDIVLVSNASMDLFPNNKLSEFKVRLPRPLHFDADYRVAVTRISWTKSFFNFELDTNITIKLSDSEAPMQMSEKTRKRSRVNVKLLPGFYDAFDFVAMINNACKKFKIDGDDVQITQPVYTLKNGYLSCEPGIYKNAAKIDIRWEAKFDPETSKILGIEKDSTRPVFLNQGWTDLYVYSDLVYPTIIGDQTAELMCMLDGQTDKDYGYHCSETFDDPWYHPIAKNNFQEITVYIRRDNGQAPNFKFGRVSIRLSFRHKNDV